VDARARYAAAAADELRKQYLADLAKEKSKPAPAAKTKLTFKDVGGMLTSGDLTSSTRITWRRSLRPTRHRG
jgi:hypothetical protein